MNLRRVVVTGLGIVSSIGNNKKDVLDSLKNTQSGITFNENYAELGFRSQICGSINIDTKQMIDRKLLRFMGDAAAYNYIAMAEAIEDAGMDENLISNENTGLITGSGGSSTENVVLAADLLRQKGIRKVGAFMVPRTMSSTTSACLATAFKIKGKSYSISSACATSAHCIGHGYELIQMGKQDVVFAGGGEEEHWT
ncbi:beta-ketoacyl synthase N-terminal-like domain-containing protein [Kaarinaea lacus]